MHECACPSQARQAVACRAPADALHDDLASVRGRMRSRVAATPNESARRRHRLLGSALDPWTPRAGASHDSDAEDAHRIRPHVRDLQGPISAGHGGSPWRARGEQAAASSGCEPDDTRPEPHREHEIGEPCKALACPRAAPAAAEAPATTTITTARTGEATRGIAQRPPVPRPQASVTRRPFRPAERTRRPSREPDCASHRQLAGVT